LKMHYSLVIQYENMQFVLDLLCVCARVCVCVCVSLIVQLAV